MMKHHGTAQQRMEKCLDSLRENLQVIRTSRAHPSLLDRIKVDYYGTATPLKQLATIAIPEARQLLIQPFDRSSLASIEKAIQASDLGLTPNNDGKVLRIKLPHLTEERRKQLVKQVRATTEEARVAVRNVRRDLNVHLKKDEGLTEDEQKRESDAIQKLTDKIVGNIDTMAKEKETEILAV